MGDLARVEALRYGLTILVKNPEGKNHFGD
jgi:hypothetical protein